MLLGQYIERFYYGGLKRSHLAGKVRLDLTADDLILEERDEDDTCWNRMLEGLTDMVWWMCMYVCCGRFCVTGAAIHPSATESVTGTESEMGTALGGVNAIKSGSLPPSLPKDDGDEVGSVASAMSQVSRLSGPSGVLPQSSATLAESASLDAVPENGEEAEGNNEYDEEANAMELGEVKSQATGSIASSQYLAEEAEAARQRQIEAMRLRAEANALVKEWMEWTCIVCGLENKENKFPEPQTTIGFGVQGVYYKRVYAILRHDRVMPRCRHCFTYADYEPPLGSAHLFPHNPRPFAAFENYPQEVAVHANLSIHPLVKAFHAISSIFLGVRHQHSSLLLFPDWRTPIYITSHFPEIPRQYKPPTEPYEIGETVECRVQRSDWCRCKITQAHVNNTYDILYENGVALRFVAEDQLRLFPEKRDYAYRVELAMVWMVFATPLSLLALVTPGYESFSGMFLLVPSGGLLVLQLFKFCWHVYHYYEAGLCMLFGLTMLFTTPIVLLLMLGVFLFLDPLKSGSTVSVLGMAMMWSSVPALYCMKPTYALMGILVFAQLSAGLVFYSSMMFPLWIINLAPFATTVVTVMLYRQSLNRIWDVCLKIRPTKEYLELLSHGEPETLWQRIRRWAVELWTQETICGYFWDKISDCLGAFS